MRLKLTEYVNCEYVHIYIICVHTSSLSSVRYLGHNFIPSVYAMPCHASAMSQTLMNIMVKSVQKQYNYSGVQSFMGMTIVCTFLTSGLMIAQSTSAPASTGTEAAAVGVSSMTTLHSVLLKAVSGGDKWPLLLTLIAALAYHVEYALNFIFSGYVSNVSFSVSDIARRICIICIGSVMFSKTLTGMNWVGIVIAIGGVLWYTYLNDQETKRKAGVGEQANKKKSD